MFSVNTEKEVRGRFRAVTENLANLFWIRRRESCTVAFELRPVCVYSVIVEDNGQESFGMLYYADIRSFKMELYRKSGGECVVLMGNLEELHSEIEKITITDKLPEDWTYPEIQPKLLEEAQNRGFL